MPVLDIAGKCRMTARWRWLEDAKPGTPEGNMAADALLLREVQNGGLPAVRVYTWDRPCVSVGRLQDEATVGGAYPGLPLVGRPTGGRAVRHGGDLCVTVAARLSDLPLPSGSGVRASYHLLAGTLVDAFRALDVDAEFGQAGGSPSGASSVDCFAAAARCDIVDGRTGRKIAGCAQRREGKALLQQMSIPHPPQTALSFLTCLRQSFGARLSVREWVQE